jgi:hypothetical protein
MKAKPHLFLDVSAREGDRWAAVWLLLRGLKEWADLYETLVLAAKEAAAYA